MENSWVWGRFNTSLYWGKDETTKTKNGFKEGYTNLNFNDLQNKNFKLANNALIPQTAMINWIDLITNIWLQTVIELTTEWYWNCLKYPTRVLVFWLLLIFKEILFEKNYT